MTKRENNKKERRIRIGIDAGGTFTDVCIWDEVEGKFYVWKVSSSPQDPSIAISEGLKQSLKEEDLISSTISYFGHGTTVATNAIIQEKVAHTGLITTEGFRDLLEIARQKRPSLYDLQCDKPKPLVRRRDRKEVPERIRHNGNIETKLDETITKNAISELKQEGIKAIAVMFLYSFVDPVHELKVKDIIREVFPEAFVTCSHEVSPEFREFERLSTVVVNASLGPVMFGYLMKIKKRLKEFDIKGAPHITQSNGGTISFDIAAKHPVRTILSGPSTGIVGASEIGKLAGCKKIITFDMGGTSTDVALVNEGKTKISVDSIVHGHALKIPMLDINTVGAGGGSIAHVDSGGFLKVGPKSAGADPGPVCYDLGNKEPTVTDANVVLQILNPTQLLSGRMPIKRELSLSTIKKLGEKLNLSEFETAQGILSIVTANMAKAIRVVSVQRGYDPRSFSLVAFGGAGPLHASRLARELEITKIVVPPNPGILCALGLLLTNLQSNYSRTQLIPLDEISHLKIKKIFSELESEAIEWFKKEKVLKSERKFSYSIDMRYEGQNYEINIPFSYFEYTNELFFKLKSGFQEAHQQLYGYFSEDESIQLVTFRLEATGVVQKAEIPSYEPISTSVKNAKQDERKVYLPEIGGFKDCPVYNRMKLGFKHKIKGPAIIEQMDSTTLILPRQQAEIDQNLNIIITEFNK